MDVYEAVTRRRVVRGFTDRPVPTEVPERVLSAAAWSSSRADLTTRRAGGTSRP